MTLGERIKQLRLEHKLSQEKLAELIGVSGQAVTKWEKGLSDPTTENLFKMAEIFGTTVDLMIGESKPLKLDEDEAYEIYKAVRRKHAKEMLKRLKMFFGGLGIYAVLFIICKLFFLDIRQMSVSAILSPAYAGEKSDFNYIIGWLWGNNLYWYASLISALPALFGSPNVR